MQTFASSFKPIFFGLSFFLSFFGLHSALLNPFELIMRLMVMKEF
jgi:hypothetical protein